MLFERIARWAPHDWLCGGAALKQSAAKSPTKAAHQSPAARLLSLLPRLSHLPGAAAVEGLARRCGDSPGALDALRCTVEAATPSPVAPRWSPLAPPAFAALLGLASAAPKPLSLLLCALLERSMGCCEAVSHTATLLPERFTQGVEDTQSGSAAAAAAHAASGEAREWRARLRGLTEACETALAPAVAHPGPPPASPRLPSSAATPRSDT
jgi:hypothetical protein